MDKMTRNNLWRATMLMVFALGKCFATVGMWGALGWVVVREIFTPEIPIYLRIVPFLCGLAALPLYPLWALGCWLIRISGVPTKYPYWDMDEDGRP